MDIEVIIGIAAVFVSGTAIGSAATLFVQWASRKLAAPFNSARALEEGEAGMLRRDVALLTQAVKDLQDRSEFQERLLEGKPTSQVK